jgi:hypothetical protein
MSQNDVVGVLPTVDLLADAQQGVHYARQVLLLDQPAGAVLPAVGRGKAVAAADGWRAHVGRSTIVAGAAEYVLEQLTDLRSAVVLLVVGDVEAVQVRAAHLASAREVHLLPVAGAALRVIVSDAAQVVVQALGTDGWLAQATLVAPTSGPQGRRGRASRDEAAPAAETAPTGQPIAATDDAAPAPVADAQLPDPPAEIVVRPEVLDEATDTAAPSQAEQVTDTAQAEQAEES